MKIAIITQTFPAISERFILRQVIGLIDAGHDVDIFANRPPPPGPEHREVRQYRLRERTYYGLYVPPELYYRPRLFRIHHLLKKMVAGLGLNSHPFSAFRRLEACDYDIYHCQFGPEGIRCLVLRDVGLIRGKLVTSFRGFDASRYPKEQGANVYDQLFRQGDFFFAVSESMRKRVIQLGCDPVRIAVNREPVDTNPITLRSKPLSHSKQASIITVARLTEKKGLEYAIRAVAILIAQGRNITYDLIGDGALREQLQKLTRDLGLSHVVHFRGSMSHHDVLEHLAEADLFLGPSVTAADGDEEGVPNTLMEALSLGVPVVATDHAGIPELIEDGVSGLLVPERDSEALAHSAGLLLDQPELGWQMARAGRAVVERLHNPQTVLSELEAHYRALLADDSTYPNPTRARSGF